MGHLSWPKGCTSIEDVPWDVLAVINHSHTILQWQENLSSDEMPPAWMWPFNDEISEWLEDVTAARKSGSDFERDDRVQVHMTENEHASRFKK